ncbi:hypothetical protein [Aquimarina aquimarini]|uniref:hypothetical protein n=1 Tax=Aquimarina aquimarini TaxID=1191734 RepID=UPI00131EFB60|nr:hypothetical protein [Aquimarina aquimarini]
MKKIWLILLIVINIYSCVEEENYLYEGNSILAFSSEEATAEFAHDEVLEKTIMVTIQLIGQQQTTAIIANIKLDESNITSSEKKINFPSIVSIPANSSSTNFEITIYPNKFEDQEKVIATFQIEANGTNQESGVNLSKFTLNIKKLPVPDCNKDFTPYSGDYSITTGDSFGYSWSWDGRNNLPLQLDPNIINRLSSTNFYGWTDSQPVFFELSCTDNTINVIPIVGYTTSGGYTFDITGGSGTYTSQGEINVTYQCLDSTDGDFTITETYTKTGGICTVNIAQFALPYIIQTGDSFGYSWDWDGRADFTLITDPDTPLLLSNTNFYGWENTQPVFFELSCTTDVVTVVPINGYTTPGGYIFDITGGIGTYTPQGEINVTYQCSHPTDGNFTITEVYAR